MMNVADFAKWDIALTQEKRLRPESLKEMTTPVRLNRGRAVSHELADGDEDRDLVRVSWRGEAGEQHFNLDPPSPETGGIEWRRRRDHGI
jgi:hypothetical protein